ncbi:MAG: D-amino acid aminotransferase [Azoarcus sp.]|jgi:D-alanine transaminase|nr:D-amino acid aminotransferase [Azoarcus sp.]
MNTLSAPASLCYLNGEFLLLANARISPLDRGFLFGDGAYEVIPCYARKPLRLAEHLLRLVNTLEGIRLPNPHHAGEWAEIIAKVLDGNPWDNQSIYLQVTRGAPPARKHTFPENTPPTVFLMSEQLTTPSIEQFNAGASAISASDDRWLHCDFKTVSLIANCLLKQRAQDANCIEIILFRDGFLTEASSSNVFAVRNDVLLAPPRNHLILPGITYDLVLELAARHNIPHEVRAITEYEARTADELWVTSSTKEILPITTLDGQPVGNGRVGAMAHKMYALYQDFKHTLILHG